MTVHNWVSVPGFAAFDDGHMHHQIAGGGDSGFADRINVAWLRGIGIGVPGLGDHGGRAAGKRYDIFAAGQKQPHAEADGIAAQKQNQHNGNQGKHTPQEGVKLPMGAVFLVHVDSPL